jgi:hypothetical protein
MGLHAPDEIADRAVKIVRDTDHLLPLRAKKLAVAVVNPHNDAVHLDLAPNAEPDDADVLVLALVIRPKSGAGTISVPEEIQRLAQRHARKTIAISFGSPYILRELGDVSTFVCAWGPQPVMQRAAMRAIRAK